MKASLPDPRQRLSVPSVFLRSERSVPSASLRALRVLLLNRFLMLDDLSDPADPRLASVVAGGAGPGEACATNQPTPLRHHRGPRRRFRRRRAPYAHLLPDVRHPADRDTARGFLRDPLALRLSGVTRPFQVGSPVGFSPSRSTYHRDRPRRPASSARLSYFLKQTFRRLRHRGRFRSGVEGPDFLEARNRAHGREAGGVDFGL